MDATTKRQLHTGREIPLFGLGTWELTDDTAGAIVAALELGYPMIDTSGDYGTQPGISKGIEESGLARAHIYLVTKVEEDENAYDATRRDLEELGVEYADLMLIHRPPKEGAGVALWRDLVRARNDGLTKDIGVSNYPMELIDELVEETGEVPAVDQIEWSPFGFHEEMLDYARRNGIVIMAYSPLTRATRLDDERLRRLADEYRKTPAQVVLRWHLQKGTVPIPKANSIAHLKENKALFDFELTDDDMRTLDGFNAHYSALGELPYV